MNFGDILSNDEGSDNELAWNDAEDEVISGADDAINEQNEIIGKKRKNKNFEDVKHKKKIRRERPVAPPTTEEMIHLRETETLFKSNLFRLEIEEMLKEIKPMKTFQNAANIWINNLKKYLLNLDDEEDWINVSETDWLNNINVCLPLPDLNKFHDGAYKFLKPIDVKAVGSFSADCTAGPKFNVDVAIIVPAAFYRKKDYLNQTYHYKRALYLCAIAGHLQNSELIASNSCLKFTCINGDTLKPVLIVNPQGKAADKIDVLIHVIPAKEPFLLKRFIPSLNNVRPSWWGCQNNISTASIGTPIYNTSIVEDLVMESNEKLRQEYYQNDKNMKEALCLLRVWLKQRCLEQGCGAFSAYILSMVLIYLKDKQKINKHMSSYQIMRNVWLYLSQSNWCKEGASMCKADIENVPAVSVFLDYFDVVFIDPSGYLNLTAYMNKLTYLKVRSESLVAIELLDNSEINGFQALFMIKMPFMNQYDHILRFPLEEVINVTAENYGKLGSVIDYNGNPLPVFTKLIGDLLEKGLDDRITEINVKLTETISWDVKTIRPSPIPVSDSLMFGMRIHSINGLSIVNKGPESNLPEAIEFRKFWGKKSELRRFKGGLVCECTVWGREDLPLSQRFVLNKGIVLHLLHEKFCIFANKYMFIANEFDSTIEHKIYDISAEDACLKIHKTLEEFSRQLVELNDLPLEVTTVNCISPAYCYADVFPPIPCYSSEKLKENENVWTFTPGGCILDKEISTAPPFVAPIDLVLQMTFTRRWPDDLAACKRLTAAFYIAIAKKLHHKHNLKFLLHSDCLVVEKNGLLFRLFLGYSKEISLLKMNITKEGVKQYRDTPESIELEKKFINLPSITGALHGLSVAEPGFGCSTRLVKRWLTSHMLDSFHFPSVIVELIVASLFIKPQPFQRLVQPQQVFLRFLNLMATTNWHTELLVVNLNNILTKEEVRKLESKFEKERSSFPPLVIATPYDKSGTLWTRKAPSLSILVRVAKLASVTQDVIHGYPSNAVPKNIQSLLFTPNLTIYDVLIVLNSSMIPRRFEKASFKTFKKSVDLDSKVISLPVTDFDPPQLYLSYLRDHYDDFALFFYDPHGGSTIGVLFRPSLFNSSEFKVNSVGGKFPNHDDDPICLKTNFKSIISDFKEAGEGIVESVTISNKLQDIIDR